MIRAVFGTLAILAGLGIAVYFLSQGKLANEPSPKPPAQTQVAVHPAPPAAGPAAPPAIAPAPSSVPPQVEKKFAPLPTLEPKKKPGLVVGKFRHYKDAERLLYKIKKKHLPGFIHKEGKEYEVWVGPFATPQEAERAGKSLKTTLKLSSQQREYEVPVPK